jgi:hypothetical protein
MRAFGLVVCASAIALCACHLSHNDYAVTPGDGSTYDADHDGNFDGVVGDSGNPGDTPPGFDGPPPVDDTGIEDFGGPPPPGTHIEAVIDATGGSLIGATGTPLAGVKLVVPAGALSAPTTIAVDLSPVLAPSPTDGTPLTPYVRVGPDGLPFAVPARLTLPWSAAPTAPHLLMLARIGSNWSALLDPNADATMQFVECSMRRASPAQGFAFTLKDTPAPTSFSPTSVAAGDVVFLSGTGFGIAPAWSMPDDAGTSIVSNVTVGGAIVQTLAWSDTAISFVAPATGGTIGVLTPAGSGSTSTSLVIP